MSSVVLELECPASWAIADADADAGGALAAYAAVCVAVIATVMASRDVTARLAIPQPVTSGRGEPGRLVRRCR